MCSVGARYLSFDTKQPLIIKKYFDVAGCQLDKASCVFIDVRDYQAQVSVYVDCSSNTRHR